jgi:hypothetical protein
VGRERIALDVLLNAPHGLTPTAWCAAIAQRLPDADTTEIAKTVSGLIADHPDIRRIGIRNGETLYTHLHLLL